MTACTEFRCNKPGKYTAKARRYGNGDDAIYVPVCGAHRNILARGRSIYTGETTIWGVMDAEHQRIADIRSARAELHRAENRRIMAERSLGSYIADGHTPMDALGLLQDVRDARLHEHECSALLQSLEGDRP